MTKKIEPPSHVIGVTKEIERLLCFTDPQGRKLGSWKNAVYAFYDYDREPHYIGETNETAGTRIRRHLTGQRTDAVTQGVIDPQEVLNIEVWLLDSDGVSKKALKEYSLRAEYSVHEQLLQKSQWKHLITEKEIKARPLVDLPPSTIHTIVPANIYQERSHPDTTMARRLANLHKIVDRSMNRSISSRLRRIFWERLSRLQLKAKDCCPGIKLSRQLELLCG